MSEFREALGGFRERVGAESAAAPAPELHQLLARERVVHTRARLRWALAAGLALGAAAIPAYRQERQERAAAQARADAQLMRQVNEGLSRSVARAMEPLLGE